MEPESVSVKEEAKWSRDEAYVVKQGAPECCVKLEASGSPEGSTDGAEAEWGLYNEHQVKDDLVLGPECLQPQEIATERPVKLERDEACIVKQEPQCCVKLEASGEALGSTDGAEAKWSGVSTARLYDEHEVKHELVLGPECLQPQDIAVTLAIEKNWADTVKQEPVPSLWGVMGDNRHISSCLKQFALRTCFVKLERTLSKELPSKTRQTHNYKHADRKTKHREIKVNTKSAVKVKQKNQDSSTKSTTHEEDLLVKKTKNGYLCKICNKTFTAKFRLIAHQRTHTEEKPFACDICNKQFTRSAHLSCHIRKHTGEKPYTCKICSKRFSQTCSLHSHMKIHTTRKLYTCDICKRQFIDKSALIKHIHAHTCNICNIQIPFTGDRHKHMEIHKVKKPKEKKEKKEATKVTCEICQKQYFHQGLLDSHMRLHTGEKPFSCEICKVKFVHQRTLKKHIMVIHTGEKT